jgi:hypothetical protein
LKLQMNLRTGFFPDEAVVFMEMFFDILAI